MVMQTVQIRLTSKLVEHLDELVKEGYYPNKSEAVRDAVRRLIIEHDRDELETTYEEDHENKIREYSH